MAQKVQLQSKDIVEHVEMSDLIFAVNQGLPDLVNSCKGTIFEPSDLDVNSQKLPQPSRKKLQNWAKNRAATTTSVQLGSKCSLIKTFELRLRPSASWPMVVPD